MFGRRHDGARTHLHLEQATSHPTLRFHAYLVLPGRPPDDREFIGGFNDDALRQWRREIKRALKAEEEPEDDS